MGTEEGDGPGRGLEPLPGSGHLVEAPLDPGPELFDRLLRLSGGRALRDDDLHALVGVDADADAPRAGRAADGVLEVVVWHAGSWRLRGAPVGEDGSDRGGDRF